MSTQIESCESDVSERKFFRTGMEGGNVLGHSVVLQHVEEGRLSGVVQTEKEELARFLPKAQVDQSVAEPVPEKHLRCDLEDWSSSPEKIFKFRNSSRNYWEEFIIQ